MPDGEKPARKRSSESRSPLILAGLVGASGVLCYFIKGTDGVVASLEGDLALLAIMVPRMIAALAIAGLVQVLVPKDLVARWLGDASGYRGYILATAAGMLTPGGPMLSFPLVLALKAAGANTPALITYLTSWALLGVHRVVMWEIPLFGTEFAVVRYLVSLPMPILAGLITTALIARMKPVT
ncbi:MAG: permease [Rhodospirillales bacterium]|jgi:uncharacterized membrane protein YraQ (UPF0718 family)|nr:permease [Rhodospirillales bacterium]